jgi:hypothetical protein
MCHVRPGGASAGSRACWHAPATVYSISRSSSTTRERWGGCALTRQGRCGFVGETASGAVLALEGIRLKNDGCSLHRVFMSLLMDLMLLPVYSFILSNLAVISGKTPNGRKVYNLVRRFSLIHLSSGSLRKCKTLFDAYKRTVAPAIFCAAHARLSPRAHASTTLGPAPADRRPRAQRRRRSWWRACPDRRAARLAGRRWQECRCG